MTAQADLGLVKDPAQVEADGDTIVTVSYQGETYPFPASLEDADGDVLDAVDDQKLSHALQGLMSPEDWRRFKATKPKVKDYAGLFSEYAKAIGLESTGN